MKFNFNVEPEFYSGIERLAPILGYETGSGIDVTAVKGERTGVSLADNKATIYYKEKPHFFRALGLLTEAVKNEDKFEIFSDTHFKTVGAMIDTSRCGVPTVKTIKRLIDHMAAMGYTMAMLYTEDVLELEGYPYFGYMRGRYSMADLKEIDDYAYEYGIEIIPCIECYSHMEKYLMWDEAFPIRDTARVLMAREQKTFEFLDKLISSVSSALRTKRIHIGMDEAGGMGLGNFLDKHGYVPAFDIFTEYLAEIEKITDKYGLTPMMWSDMYFNISCKTVAHSYYEEETEIPEDVKAKIPKNMDLVFWHYGEHPYCDDYMLKKHKALQRNTIFAGGNWGWIGHFPEHNYMMSTNRFSINACRSNDVREAMFTIWCNDNAECDPFANLFGLSYFAELCYGKDPDDEYIKGRFEACTGADYELFYKMSYYHCDFERFPEFSKYNQRFLGKPLFWQDIMEGLYDTHLFEKKMSAHYESAREIYRGKENDQSWGYLYKYAFCAFDYLASKTKIAELLVPAYKAGDREALRDIADVLLPELKEKTISVHRAHKSAWFKNNKIIGWQNLDVRYGGVKERCDTAADLINAYLDGEIPTLEELDEQRLHKGLSGFVHYSGIATVNLKT